MTPRVDAGYRRGAGVTQRGEECEWGHGSRWVGGCVTVCV